MRKLASLLTSTLIVAGCSTVPVPAPIAPIVGEEAIAGSYKTCPDGTQIRRNRSCPIVPSFSVRSDTFAETAGTVTIHIDKTGSNGQSSSISYKTADSTAVAGKDYSARSGSITFNSTQTAGTFTVPILDDSVVETTESFLVTLTPNSNAKITQNGVITITDNDTVIPPPTTVTCPDGSVIPSDQQCPAAPPTPPSPPPAPAPTQPTVGVPSDTIFGEAAIASPFDVNLGLHPAWGSGDIPGTAAPDVVGAFRFICGAGHVARDDPIVYPGQPGKSHLHQFFGNDSVDANSTYASLRAAGTSTCNNTPYPLNLSAYWIPAMLDGAGSVVQPDSVAIYYKRRPKDDPKCTTGNTQAEGTCVPIPNGLKMIFGFNMLSPTDTPTGSLHWDCSGPTATPGAHANINLEIALCPYNSTPGAKQNQLIGVVDAPSCWDGANLDSADHRSHVGYKSYGSWGYPKCDSGHPFVIPTFHLAALYTVDANFAAGKWHLSSDEMISGAVPGTTFHSDYFGAWDNTAMTMWIQNDIDLLLNASGGDLGNGLQLNGASQPAYGWLNPNHLIPVP